MANAERGEVSFVVDGETYTLQMTINGMCELEEFLSTKDRRVTFQDVAVLVASSSFTHVRAFLWAAFQEHHPGITLKEAGTLIQRAGGLVKAARVAASLMEAVNVDHDDLATLGVTAEADPTAASQGAQGRVAGNGARSLPRLAVQGSRGRRSTG